MSIHGQCEDDAHGLGVYETLEKLAYLWGDGTDYYTRTGDTDGAGERACLYAQALWLVDRAPDVAQPEEPIGERPELDAFSASLIEAMRKGLST